MALRDFLFGFKFLATDYVSPVLKNIENRIEAVNAQVKNTARWREAGTNLAVVGAGFAAAGGAVALALRSTVNAAAEMQTEMTHVATAISDGAASHLHLAQAQALSEKLSIASGLAAKQEAQAYYIARSNLLDHAQAMSAVQVATKLTIGTTASLADAQTQLEPTTRLLTTVFQNFGNKSLSADAQINRFADTMAKLQTQFAFKDIGEVNEAMSYAVPLAKSAGVAFNDMSAALAVLSASGKHGAEAGTAFAELVQKLSTAPKLRGLVAHTAAGGIDLGRTLDTLKRATAGRDAIQTALYLHELGFTERSIVGVSLLIDKTNIYRSAVTDLNNAQGANAAAFAVRQASMEIATGRLSAAWDVFKAKIGENLLGPVTSFATVLTSVVTRLTEFATAHAAITKFVVLFAAMGAALAIVVGGAIALVGGLLAAGSFIGVGGAVLATIAGIGVAVAAVVAAVAVWGPRIGGFFSSIWTGAHNALVGMGDAINAFIPKLFAGGVNLVMAIGRGIWSAITFPQHAMEAVVSKIRAYLPFSPAKEGPLRQLHRVRIVEEVARSIQPGPALTAIRRTAAAVALAAPIMLTPMQTSPAFAASSPIAVPALAQRAFSAPVTLAPILAHRDFAAAVMLTPRLAHPVFSASAPTFTSTLAHRNFSAAVTLTPNLVHRDFSAPVMLTPYLAHLAFSAAATLTPNLSHKAFSASVTLAPTLAYRAFAAPVTLTPKMSGPALAGSAGVARDGSAITIQVHQDIHIDGAIAGDEQKVMAMLRHHGEELAQIIDARLLHRSRREF